MMEEELENEIQCQNKTHQALEKLKALRFTIYQEKTEAEHRLKIEEALISGCKTSLRSTDRFIRMGEAVSHTTLSS